MSFGKYFYIFTILNNIFLIGWCFMSFNSFREDYVNNTVMIENETSKLIIFSTIIMFINSIISLNCYLLPLINIFTSSIIILVNLGNVTKCDNSCKLILNNLQYQGIYNLQIASLIIQPINVVTYILIICSLRSPNYFKSYASLYFNINDDSSYNYDENTQNNIENNVDIDNDNDSDTEDEEKKSLILNKSYSQTTLYNYYPSLENI
tara:strand:- start:497 stop:1117 length:621 start_codon:yes stop_codon:yes gene_type:complete